MALQKAKIPERNSNIKICSINMCTICAKCIRKGSGSGAWALNCNMFEQCLGWKMCSRLAHIGSTPWRETAVGMRREKNYVYCTWSDTCGIYLTMRCHTFQYSIPNIKTNIVPVSALLLLFIKKKKKKNHLCGIFR